jgi:hypothetical protein
MMSDVLHLKMGVSIWHSLNLVCGEKVILKSCAFSCAHKVVVVEIGALRFEDNLCAHMSRHMVHMYHWTWGGHACRDEYKHFNNPMEVK